MALFFNKSIHSYEELLLDQLASLYDAEQQLITAIPAMAEKTHSIDLESALRDQLHESEFQVARLERIFTLLDRDPPAETCKGMKGLIDESQEIVEADGKVEVKDAALTAAALRMTCYQIIFYTAAHALAQRLGHDEIARLLGEILDEKKASEHRLAELAEHEIGHGAAVECN